MNIGLKVEIISSKVTFGAWAVWNTSVASLGLERGSLKSADIQLHLEWIWLNLSVLLSFCEFFIWMYFKTPTSLYWLNQKIFGLVEVTVEWCCTPIGSSVSALSKVFWVQVDRRGRSTANGRKLKMAGAAEVKCWDQVLHLRTANPKPDVLGTSWAIDWCNPWRIQSISSFWFDLLPKSL